MRERHAGKEESQGQGLVDAAAAGSKVLQTLIDLIKSDHPNQGIIHIRAVEND
jgi:hypothetical protein